MSVARIARLCKTDFRHVGWMVDAVEKKIGVPTCERQSKALSGMPYLVQKITGVQSFTTDELSFFATLPDVPTGGNLTLTIIEEMFKKDEVRKATDLYINFDGASDNVCYHVLYGLAHMLRCAKHNNWPLRNIHIIRFKVRVHVSLGLLVCVFTVRA